MTTKRIRQLAESLAVRDRNVGQTLVKIRESFDALRRRAELSVEAFRSTVCELGAEHLSHVAIGPVEPDEKHVDCLQFKVQRGRWEIVCVAKPRGTVVFVGPYRAGKPERPCQEHLLPSPEADAGLDDLLLDLLCEACRL